MMASASPDNIKQWKFPDGNFIQNLSGHNAILNCLAVNSDGVLVSGGEFLYFANREIRDTCICVYAGTNFPMAKRGLTNQANVHTHM